MTPFGEKLRELRRIKGISQAKMAAALEVSPAYMSALEHGKRGVPSFSFMQKLIQYFGLIWDEAENLQRLAKLSAPKVTIDTSGMDARATLLANRLAEKIGHLNEGQLDAMIDIIDPQN